VALSWDGPVLYSVEKVGDNFRLRTTRLSSTEWTSDLPVTALPEYRPLDLSVYETKAPSLLPPDGKIVSMQKMEDDTRVATVIQWENEIPTSAILALNLSNVSAPQLSPSECL